MGETLEEAQRRIYKQYTGKNWAYASGEEIPKSAAAPPSFSAPAPAPAPEASPLERYLTLKPGVIKAFETGILATFAEHFTNAFVVLVSGGEAIRVVLNDMFTGYRPERIVALTREKGYDAAMQKEFLDNVEYCIREIDSNQTEGVNELFWKKYMAMRLILEKTLKYKNKEFLIDYGRVYWEHFLSERNDTCGEALIKMLNYFQNETGDTITIFRRTHTRLPPPSIHMADPDDDDDDEGLKPPPSVANEIIGSIVYAKTAIKKMRGTPDYYRDEFEWRVLNSNLVSLNRGLYTLKLATDAAGEDYKRDKRELVSGREKQRTLENAHRRDLETRYPGAFTDDDFGGGGRKRKQSRRRKNKSRSRKNRRQTRQRS